MSQNIYRLFGFSQYFALYKKVRCPKSDAQMVPVFVLMSVVYCVLLKSKSSSAFFISRVFENMTVYDSFWVHDIELVLC